MQTAALIIHLLLTIALIVIVLIQRSEGSGVSMNSNHSGLFSPLSTSNALTRTTTVLGICFIGMSLFLSVLADQGNNSNSILDQHSSQKNTINNHDLSESIENNNIEILNSVPLLD